MVKIAGETEIQCLKILFNKYLEEYKIPDNCQIADLILIFKTENYRSISLLLHQKKLVDRIITKRITSKLNTYQTIEQQASAIDTADILAILGILTVDSGYFNLISNTHKDAYLQIQIDEDTKSDKIQIHSGI